MKVDQDAIDGIRVKVDRAHQHFTVLHDEMRAWTRQNPQPWHLVPESHDDGRKHLFRLRLDSPIPVEWAVVMGEAIHDLRSALEQSVYWLTVDNRRRALDGTGFPVVTSRAQFVKVTRAGEPTRDSGRYKIRGLGPGPQAFIESLQPYPQRRRFDPSFALLMLHDVWNQDKHRLVHLIGLRFSGDAKLKLDQRVAAACVPYIDQRIRHENAIVFKLLCDPPQHDVQVRSPSNIPWTVAFKGGTRKGGGDFSMWDIEGYTRDVVLKLLGSMGRQGDAINRQVWSSRWRP